jgi:hypothetical protein
MTCRRCHRRFRDSGDGVCPNCGEVNPPITSGVVKTSTIRISAGRTDAVYRSVNEVPGPLRKRLLKSTSGMNSATILIADRRGKEELAKAIRRLPGNAQKKLFDALFGPTAEAAINRFLKPYWRMALGGSLFAMAAAAIWFTATHKW